MNTMHHPLPLCDAHLDEAKQQQPFTNWDIQDLEDEECVRTCAVLGCDDDAAQTVWLTIQLAT